ncbi:uncharacterized protein BDZ99DRAFT_349188, partial [Mytilinidion resinicola]
QKLYEQMSFFKTNIEQLDNIARMQRFMSFIPLLDDTNVTTLSPVVVQLGMACIQIALARMWSAWGLKPVAVLGCNLGEYAALHVAGVISARDMTLLVGHPAELSEADYTAYSHGILAVRGGVEAVFPALG